MRASEAVPSAAIAGGYASADAGAVASAWVTIYANSNRAADLRLRVFLAAIEVNHRRIAAGSVRSYFSVDEVAKLCRIKSSIARAAIRWLMRHRILSTSINRQGGMTSLVIMPGVASSAVDRIREFFGGRDRLAIPRRLLRHLAGRAGGIKAIAATSLAICGRSIWPTASGCRLAGRLRLVDVSAAFGVAAATVGRVVRGALQGFAELWNLQRENAAGFSGAFGRRRRYGAIVAVSPDWSPSDEAETGQGAIVGDGGGKLCQKNQKAVEANCEAFGGGAEKSCQNRKIGADLSRQYITSLCKADGYNRTRKRRNDGNAKTQSGNHLSIADIRDVSRIDGEYWHRFRAGVIAGTRETRVRWHAAFVMAHRRNARNVAGYALSSIFAADPKPIPACDWDAAESIVKQLERQGEGSHCPIPIRFEGLPAVKSKAPPSPFGKLIGLMGIAERFMSFWRRAGHSGRPDFSIVSGKLTELGNFTRDDWICALDYLRVPK